MNLILANVHQVSSFLSHSTGSTLTRKRTGWTSCLHKPKPARCWWRNGKHVGSSVFPWEVRFSSHWCDYDQLLLTYTGANQIKIRPYLSSALFFEMEAEDKWWDDSEEEETNVGPWKGRKSVLESLMGHLFIRFLIWSSIKATQWRIPLSILTGCSQVTLLSIRKKTLCDVKPIASRTILMLPRWRNKQKAALFETL